MTKRAESLNDSSPSRRRKGVAGLALAVTAGLALLCCTGGTGAVMLTNLIGEAGSDTLGTFSSCGEQNLINADGRSSTRVGPYGPSQMRNAATIIKVGADMGVPPRGWVIAVATAMQESGLSNLPHLGSRNDHDSVGLFQQRPSQGWGTPDQLQDPAYSARKFYEKMIKVDNWQRKPLTVVAQKVQVSAYPNAYAKHERLAIQIVNTLTNGAARAVGSDRELRCPDGGEIAASGWTTPIIGSVVSGFRTASRPSHNGVDIMASRGTPIRATTGGRVLVARCDPDRRGRLSCDADGWPGKGGCGWFVDILHAGGVITRYCHMVVRPKVHVGQVVEAGQVIGLVGTSGNSSGPHLHFEVHLNSDRSSRGAIDPVPFMRERGTPLRDAG